MRKPDPRNCYTGNLGRRHFSTPRDTIMSMSPEEYALQGTRCPHCKSRAIQCVGTSEFCSRSCYNTMLCNTCGANWDEEYVLAGYINLDISETKNAPNLDP